MLWAIIYVENLIEFFSLPTENDFVYDSNSAVLSVPRILAATRWSLKLLLLEKPNLTVAKSI